MSAPVEIHITAYDEFSTVFQQVGDKVDSTLAQVNVDSEELTATTESASNSFGDSMMAMNGLALSGASLAMTFERVENAQVQVDRANLMVQRSTQSLETAQDNYNTAVQKYGASSTQAQDALSKLNIAQDAYNVAVERAEMSTRNLDNTMVMAALTVIPSLIQIIGVVSNATEIWEGIQEALNLVMDANPIYLVIAAVAALAAGIIYAYNTCETFRNDINQLGADLEAVGNAISGAVTGFANWVANSVSASSATKETSEALAEASRNAELFGADLQNAGNITVQYASAQQEAVQNLSPLQMKLSDLEEQFTLVSQSTASYDVKLKELNDSKQQVITSTDQMLSDLSQEESALEVTYGLNYRNTDAYRTLRTQIDDVTKSKSNLITKYDDLIPKITQENYLEQQTAPILADLTSKYALMQASADTALPNIQARFNDAFNSGNIQHATVIISEFAQQYGISFSDAEKTIENFKAAQATVPQTIEEQLVGKAQNDMQAFKDCMAGKTATLASDATGHMQTMASDITDLINHGLVGEAQDAMQSYVNCNTNKVGTMTLKLTDDMNTLTKNYKDQLTQMTTLADSLTGQQKDAVLKQIDDMTSQYETKMQQLKDWQAQILGQMETQTDDSFANMTDTALGHAKRMSDQLVALSIWPDMLDLMGEQTQEGLEAIEKRFAEMSGKVQGAMPSASVSTALNTVAGFAQGTTGRPITVNITGPLVMIQGNADKATVDLAAKQVLDKLKSAIVEPSSSNAGYNQKRIRSGATFT